MTLMKSSSLRPRRSSATFSRPRRGFSILELTVVLVLVGIVTAVAGTRVSAMLTQQRVTRAASIVQTDMELAFTLAGRNRKPMRLTWTSNSSGMWFKVTDRTQTVVYKSTDFKGSNFGLNVGEVTASSSAVEVYPNGFASDTLSITISALRNGTTYTKRVRMSRAGLVKVI